MIPDGKGDPILQESSQEPLLSSKYDFQVSSESESGIYVLDGSWSGSWRLGSPFMSWTTMKIVSWVVCQILVFLHD